MDIVKRLREGRTNGTDLRWQVSDAHLEAAEEIERLRRTLKEVIALARGTELNRVTVERLREIEHGL